MKKLEVVEIILKSNGLANWKVSEEDKLIVFTRVLEQPKGFKANRIAINSKDKIINCNTTYGIAEFEQFIRVYELISYIIQK